MTIEGPITQSLTLADGVRLDADIYCPSEGGPYPVLLMRQPYGRRIASTVVFAHPRWYAAQGYIVVIQDVRGTGTSEGRFRAFETEQADGAETVAWAAALPNSSGLVGMYGFSYQGMTQLLALAGGAKLGALCPVMIGWDVHGDWAYEGGAFRLSDSIGWGIQMAAIRASHDGETEAFKALSRAAKSLPLTDDTPSFPDILRRYRTLGHFADWVEHDSADAPYWQGISPRGALAGRRMDVPMLHIGGWYDTMLMGTLDGHATALATSDKPQRLVVGPWPHLPWGRASGGDMGPAADGAIDELQRDWFDAFLKDKGTIAAGLDLFDVTAKGWRHFPDWPGDTRSFHLGSTGLAVATVLDGALSDKPGDTAQDDIVHDPWRPVPSLGGHDAAPMGRQDRTAVDQRADVACYTSAPFVAEGLLVGAVDLDLFVTADALSFDVSAVLSEVTPEGRAVVLTQGYRRVTSGEALPIRISLRAICATIKPGAALRLSLAGASYPAHPVNPGTGAPPATARIDEAQVITLSVAHGGETPSHIILPWTKARSDLSTAPLRSLKQ
ncbi:CocE/NonD family hydrolase [Acidisoma cellulosilytica]|uniref:CocE/NonD family hydrolase n=1 Tax=Acidisoma cellulosilyticum TaxID=2802395 RepID=A0A963Z325_9PROT|nr:CocE/NonD family hydrolase [Acidisoma cellulosilyticum]MCB8881589.1 CocE/NonD family hydrolase [Acidisoma cellulosilyticum]